MFVNDPKRKSLHEIHSKIWSLIESKMPSFQWGADGSMQDDTPDFYYSDEIVGKEEEYDRTHLKWTRGKKIPVYVKKKDTPENLSANTAPSVLHPPADRVSREQDEAWVYFINHFENLAQEFTWEFVISNKHSAKVLMPSGASANVSEELFHRPEHETGPANTHIDVRVGTIGSGHLKYLPKLDQDRSNTDKTSSVLYGAQLYQPISFLEADFGRFLEGLKSAKLDIPKNNDALLVNDILILGIEGCWRKPEIKAKLAPKETDETWGVLWAAAVRKNGELTRPGPKPKPTLSFEELKNRLRTVHE